MFHRLKRIGVLTPSSNTVLEPMTSAIVAGIPGISAHFSRFSVTEISLGPQSTHQFDHGKVLDAAKLLAEAHVDVICWSGTSAGWLGFDTDERLCSAVSDATGIAATTAVLALNELLVRTNVQRLGLVSPYTDDVQRRILQNYARIGIDCSAERHLGIHVNHAFAAVDPPTIQKMAKEVSALGVQAVTMFCTNLRGADLAPALESQLGIPVYDTVSCVVWKALHLLGVDTHPLLGWGRMFSVQARD